MQNRIIVTVIYVVLSLLSAKAFATCDGSVVYQGRSTETNADLYARHGYVITVLDQNYYTSVANMRKSGQYQITDGNGFILAYDMKNNVITLLYPTTTGRMAVIFDGVVFPEFSKFDTCI
jgi:hypothetical protein